MESEFIREKYLKKVKPYIGKNIIKVLTGQRRVGKTTILRQIVELVKQEDSAANIIYINKEQNVFKHIKTGDDLYQYVNLQLSVSKKNYVFVDEIYYF